MTVDVHNGRIRVCKDGVYMHLTEEQAMDLYDDLHQALLEMYDSRNKPQAD